METRTTEEWSQWLKAVFRGDVVVPPLNRDSEPHLDLIDVFDRLTTFGARQAFAEGVARTFAGMSTTRADSPYLYTLLHLVAYTHPESEVDRLRHHLFVGTFQQYTYEQASLHTLLLETLGEYPLTAELTNYIKRSVPRSNDPDYAAAAMRVLAIHDRTASLDLLMPSLARLNRREDVLVIASHMKGFVGSYGYEVVYEWCLLNGRRLLDEATHAMDWFIKGLTVRGVIDSPVRRADDQPFRTVLSAVVHGALRPLAPVDVLTVASVAEVLKEELEPIFANILLQQSRLGSRITLWSVSAYGQDEQFFLCAGTQRMVVGEEWDKEIDFIAKMTGSLKPTWYSDESTPEQVHAAVEELAAKIKQT
ncbi:MAG TPA: hypothetical protein VGQ76_25975 [Thermoanaerobaculia bacterium]|jgi:hypothetical protein|nr:hypothetical protein [Thermoanaerobaculia bacterium]